MKKLFFGLVAIWGGLMLSHCSPKIDAPEVSIEIVIDTPLEFDDEGDSMEVTITCNYPWTASSNQPWCTVSPDHGPAGTFVLTITVTADVPTKGGIATRADVLTDIRTAIITIHANGEEQQITVNQEVQPTSPVIQEVDAMYQYDLYELYFVSYPDFPYPSWTDVVSGEEGASALSKNTFTTTTGITLSGLYTEGGGTIDTEIDGDPFQITWAYLYDALGKVGYVSTAVGTQDNPPYGYQVFWAVIGKTAYSMLVDINPDFSIVDYSDMQDDYNGLGGHFR